MARARSVIALAIIFVSLILLRVDAQQAPRVFRIGWLSQGRPGDIPGAVESFIRRLGALGYVEGRNLVFESRWAEGETGRLPGLAAELVRMNVDVIVTFGPAATITAARATTVIPIVMVAVGSPVERGLVASLARPDGNVTGLSFDTGSAIHGKRLALLKEAIPRLSRVATLGDPTIARAATPKALQAAAQALGLTLQQVQAGAPEEFDKAFTAITRMRPEALFVLPSPMFSGNTSRITAFTAKSRIPSMYATRVHVDAGGLMSYGPSQIDLHVRAASYVDAILKGANPGDLPVQQPTRFELVINLKAARALGLTMPPSLLQRADEIIR